VPVPPLGPPPGEDDTDDRLALVFMCCHPALEPEARLALTLRSVAGMRTEDIAALFLLPRATLAQRLVRAKRKIAAARIPFRVPSAAELPGRLDDVLRVITLLYTHGHRDPERAPAARAEAIRMAGLVAVLVPGEPEPIALLALLLLVDARQDGRIDSEGMIVTLDEQDRSRWDHDQIAEGVRLLDDAMQAGRPGPYQLQAAIAALHSGVASAADTDWWQIALLYGELLRYEPSPVVEANRAVAVAMAEGPAAGLVILDIIAGDDRLARWPQLHIARAELLRRLDRPDEAADAYRAALALEPPEVERRFIMGRLQAIDPG
jgi:RNA polymerase sigma-70 factor (ECF subfamily)